MLAICCNRPSVIRPVTSPLVVLTDPLACTSLIELTLIGQTIYISRVVLFKHGLHPKSKYGLTAHIHSYVWLSDQNRGLLPATELNHNSVCLESIVA